MSFTNIKAKSQGFTIVELLIVVVVIAILAAITIVSYNGITSRANQSSAKASAASVLKKAEAFNADNGVYPRLSTYLTAGTTFVSSPSYPTGTGASWYMTGTTITYQAAAWTAAPANPTSTVRVVPCGAATIAATTDANITGLKYFIWDATTNSDVAAGTSGVTTTCAAS